MNRELIKKNIIEILSGESDITSGVVLLNGKWGCGKTYLWRQTIMPELEEKLSKEGIPVVYISLFGLTSIEDVKNSIVTQLVLKGHEKSSYKEIFKNSKPLLFQFINQAQKIVGFEFFNFKADPMELWSKEFVICFDDLERKAGSVDLKSILGFISYLKEFRKARLLLIANEESISSSETSLSKNEAKAYKQFIEKVVSIRFKLSASVEDFYDNLSESYNSLGISYLKENRSEIIGLFQQTRLDNLRTIEKFCTSLFMILKHDINISSTYLKILYFYVVSNSEGFLANGSDYFNFHLYSLKSESKNNNISEEDKIKLKHMSRFFEDSLEYNFCDPLFEFVLNGLTDVKAIKYAIDPNPEELNPAQKYLRSLSHGKGQHLFFMNDLEINERYDEGIKVLESCDDYISADLLANLVSHLKICKKILNEEFPLDKSEKVKVLFQKCAVNGDSSFKGSMRVYLGHYREYFEEYLESYDNKIDEGVMNRAQDKILCMFRENKMYDFIEFIRHCSENLVAYCTKIKPEEVVSLYFNNREFGYDAIKEGFGNLRIIPSQDETRNKCQKKLYYFIESILSSERLEKSDQFRMRELYNKVSQIAPVSDDSRGQQFPLIKKLVS